MKLPSLLQPVFQQVCELQGGTHSLTVLARHEEDPIAGWTASPRLLAIPGETTPIKHRKYYSAFVGSCMAGILIQSADSKEVEVTAANAFYTASNDKYKVFGTQLGGYDSQNIQFGGPLFDCIDYWPPPNTGSWRFRFVPDDSAQRATYGDFFIVLHLYAAGRNTWEFYRRECPGGTRP